MTTFIIPGDCSDGSDSDDQHHHEDTNVYLQVTGPSAWWRRLTGQGPQYRRASMWAEHPSRRGRWLRYTAAGVGLGPRSRIVSTHDISSEDSVIPIDSIRGRRQYRTRPLSPVYCRSPSPRRYRFYSLSPIGHRSRWGCRHVPENGCAWYWPRQRDRAYDEYYRSAPPPPEPPRSFPTLPAPPMPPPNRTRPSQLRQERGDRYAESQEARYRDECIRLRRENIQEMEYEAEYKERMPDWRKGAFQYRDREARQDRIEELQEILRGARIAADRDEMETRVRSGVV